MPNNRRQWICRGVFLLLGLCPVLATLGWAAYRWTVYDTAAYRDWIAGQTGLDIRIHNVITAAPHTVRLLGVNIVDPENGQHIARCREATIRDGVEAVGIRLPNIEIEDRQFRRFLELLHERVLRQRRLLDRPIHLVADQIRLASPGTSRVLSEFRMDIQRTSQGPEVMLTFRWQGDSAGELVRLHLLRDVTSQPTKTKIELLTGSTPLPCSLLFRFPEPYVSLAKDASFRGDLHATSSPTGWSGELAGNIHNVSLAAFFTDGPPRITGLATIAVRRAKFRDNWITGLSGVVVADAGTIANALLQTARDRLGMTGDLDLSLPTATEMIDFERLAVDFRLSPEAIVLQGVAKGPRSSVALYRGSEQILISNGTPLSPDTVARVALGLNDRQMPVYTAKSPFLRFLLPALR